MRSPEISFFVPGVPAPQGSKTAGVKNGKARMWESNPATKPWRRIVTWHAVKYRGIFPKDTPIELTCRFYFERPKTVKRKHYTVKPDLDKLTRSIGDSLTEAGVYADDNQIVRFGEGHGKYYAGAEHKPGVHITLRRIS